MSWKHRSSRCTSSSKIHFPQSGTLNTLYEPLSLKEVRLLHLLPPRESHADLQSQHLSWNIQCELVNTKLDDCPDYEALSYTWGGSSAEHQIEINGRKIKAQSNLAHALATLRGRDTRVLWVDALCINQIDIPERNRQVALMGEIYRRARRVLTWLGVHPLPFVTEVIHLIKQLGNCPPVSMLPLEPPSTSIMNTAAYVTWIDAVLLDQREENPLKSQDSALDLMDYKWVSLLERWEELRREQQINQRMTMQHLESLQKLEGQRQRMVHRRDLVPLLKKLRRRIDGCLAAHQLKASAILHDLPMKVGAQSKKTSADWHPINK